MGPLLVVTFFKGRLYEKRHCEHSEEVSDKIDKECHDHLHEKFEELKMMIYPLNENADGRDRNERIVAVDGYVARRYGSPVDVLPAVSGR